MAEKLRSRHSSLAMVDANKSSPFTVQPDLQGHGKLIRIRPYRPSDSAQVDELFTEGIVHGPQSLLQAMYSAQLKGPTACVSYCALSLGILLATFLTSPWIRYIGIALGISGCALFAAHRYISLDALQRGWEGGLNDISETFEMKPIVSQNGERTGEYITSGPSGFWVAETYELKGSEIDDSRTKIIGSIGLLAANKNSDKTSAELRRMVVLPDYRRCGIAKSLVKTALNHAQNHGVTSIVLYTSIFQLPAVAMYEKYGWVRQNEVGIMILLDRVSVFFYCLDLATAKI